MPDLLYQDTGVIVHVRSEAGDIAAGALAVGAIAAGAVASGALAAGAISDGADVAEGSTIDTPASTSDAETTTARTVVGLLKAIKNLLLKPYRPVTVYNATGSAAINLATAETGRFRLVCVTIKFSAAPTTSEFITATLDAIDGAAYDCVLFKVNPSVGALTDILYEPSGAALIFEAGDNIALNFANTDTRTYGVRIVVEPC